MTYPTGIMELDLFNFIISKIKSSNLKIKYIYLHWRGEPCIVPYLPEAIKKIKENLHVIVILFTNGTLLNKELSNKLLLSGLDCINFSIDTNNDMKYHEIRGKDILSTVKENIEFIINRKNELNKKIKIEIYSVLLKNNIFDLLNIKNEWFKVVDKINIKFDMRNNLDFKVVSQSKCFWPYSNFIVGWDGNVSACCMDVNLCYSLGNIKDQTIEEIFFSSRISNLRNGIENKVIINKVCNNCIYFE
jgi:radical SAM protein with 4Fe4S-binding SPASM domain